MGASCAGITDGRTQYVENGFSLLDLVKHAVKTIILTLRPQDRLSIIIFDSKTEVAFEISETGFPNHSKNSKRRGLILGTPAPLDRAAFETF